MIENYQEQKELEEKDPVDSNFARIIDIYANGLLIQIEGESEPRTKLCRCNRFGVFHVGDRVKIIKDGGTYVVEYPIGMPLAELDFSGKYVGTGPWEIMDATGTLDSATSRINRIISALKAFGMAT